jgi:hypothetical protein
MIDTMARATVRIAVTLLVVVASATVCRAASSRPSQPPYPPTPHTGTKYVSKRYGYSIVLRGKYVLVPAKLQWDGRFPFGDTGMVDLIAGVYIDHKFVVAAEPVPAGMTLSEWEAFVVGVQRSFCGGLRNFRASSLGGEPAQEFVNTCSNAPSVPWRVITLAALHNGRGYLLNYLSESTSSAAAEHRNYDAGRRSFHFTQK